MQSMLKILSLCILLSGMFVAGYFTHRPTPTGAVSDRKPLYYHDPMHPSYRSDHPGIAPDCGMALEPVYSESETPARDMPVPLPPGSVRLSSFKQQLIGLETVPVTSHSGTLTVHAAGRIAVDETRVDRVSALADGVVRSVSAYAAGSMVKKDEVLATYFVASRDIYNAVQAFVLASGTFDQAASAVRSGLIKSSKANARTDEELLRSYGFTAAQIRDLSRTREVTRDIDFRTPISGLVLSRNVSRDQVVTRGAELFRIADISHVWVLASVYENDVRAFRPGGIATVTYGGRKYQARITGSRQFDAAARTLEVRLEMDNPGLMLRPDMFVDVQASVPQPAGLAVPFESLLNSGRSKIVFVSSSAGVFEPRQVTVGAEYDDRVQIVSGLHEGEHVVVAGMFLLDSESRLQNAASTQATAAPAAVKLVSVKTASTPINEVDPVCGMPLSPEDKGKVAVYEGHSVKLCSPSCKSKFEKNPAAYYNKIRAKPADSAHRGRM